MAAAVLRLGDTGPRVRSLQTAINARGRTRGVHVDVDGELGPQTQRAEIELGRMLGVEPFKGSTKAAARRQRVIRHPNLRTPAERNRARKRAAADRKAASSLPLRERAYQEASRLIGVMEQGGNNRGREVEQIIREGGGLPGQAWCGWFMAAVYRRAGSRAVVWQWGAVRLLWPLAGVSRTSAPKRGDLVRFTFDHVGMFVRDRGDGSIETIEGNTGRTGAVSDSATGGDGVYRKVRSKGLVRDYLHIDK